MIATHRIRLLKPQCIELSHSPRQLQVNTTHFRVNGICNRSHYYGRMGQFNSQYVSLRFRQVAKDLAELRSIRLTTAPESQSSKQYGDHESACGLWNRVFNDETAGVCPDMRPIIIPSREISFTGIAVDGKHILSRVIVWISRRPVRIVPIFARNPGPPAVWLWTTALNSAEMVNGARGFAR